MWVCLDPSWGLTCQPFSVDVSFPEISQRIFSRTTRITLQTFAKNAFCVRILMCWKCSIKWVFLCINKIIDILASLVYPIDSCFFCKKPGLKTAVLFLHSWKKTPTYFWNAFICNLVLIFLKMWLMMVYHRKLTRNKEKV